MRLFHELGLWANTGIFAVAAVVVWLAGTRVSLLADTIARKTGIGHAVIGLLLLGGVTSLPEIGVTVTAAWIGNASLAVNNLLGSIALQVAILAVVDAAIGRRALTSVVPDATVLIQGTLSILLLALPVAAVVCGDIAFLGVGLWAWGCLTAYLISTWLLSRNKGNMPWSPVSRNEARGVDPERQHDQLQPQARSGSADDEGESLGRVVAKVSGLAAVILIAGFAVSQTGDAIAAQSGMGSSVVGYVLVAAATSLPELSSTLSAARIGNYTMALSNILGTNLLNVGLLFVVDLVASGDPVLTRVGSFAAFGALLGIVLTGIFMVGLLERRDRTILRMGYDSAAVIVYLGGMVLLYNLR